MPRWLAFRTVGSVFATMLVLGAIVTPSTFGAGPSVTESAGPSTGAATAPPSAPVSSEAAGSSYGGDSNQVRARALVNAAINLTDSERAVKLLWQATEIDPNLAEAYIYLGLFYNSRSNFGKVVEVYQRLVKFQPKEVSAYLNIGEAYMSYVPPKMDDALPYYRKALELSPTSSFAALRMGQIFAQQGNRADAVKFLRLASADRKNPDIAAQADKFLREMGS